MKDQDELLVAAEIEEKINKYLSEYTDHMGVRVLKGGVISFISDNGSNEIHILHLKNIVEIVEGREPVDYSNRFYL